MAFHPAIDAILAGSSPRDLESTTLDFKQEADGVKRTFEILADAVVCFANAEGGTVILGVSDKSRGRAAFLGVSPSLDTSTLIRAIFDRTRPPLSVPVKEHDVDGIRLIEIIVPRGATFYANARGTATRRVNDACVPFPPEEQRQALASRGLYDWSAQPSGIRGFDDEEILRVRRLLRESGREDLATQPDRALLSDLRLLSASGDLTNAGLLLVGRQNDIASVIPDYGYSYQYRPTPGSESTSRFRGNRPLLAAAEQLIDAVESRATLTPLNVGGGVQLQRQDYPEEAIRELVVNALVHRDYEMVGSVDVEQSPQALHVVSPGGLVFGVTPENILSHPSTPRNRLLLETVTTLHVAERTGQGIDRAYRALLRTGKKPPTFTDSGASVDVQVPGGAGNDAFTRYVRTMLPEALSVDIEALLIISMLCDQRRVAAASVAPVIQRSIADAQRALERLAAADVISATRRTASSPTPNYELTSPALIGLGLAVSYHRRSSDNADDKVAEHLREYGYITNQTLRRLFDVDVYTARNMLRDLQARGVIFKEDESARGPGVRYRPPRHRDEK